MDGYRHLAPLSSPARNATSDRGSRTARTASPAIAHTCGLGTEECRAQRNGPKEQRGYYVIPKDPAQNVAQKYDSRTAPMARPATAPTKCGGKRNIQSPDLPVTKSRSTGHKQGYNRDYYAAHREERQSYSRSYYALHKSADPDKTRAYFRAYYASHREEMNHHSATRRIRKLGNGGTHTLTEWRAKCLDFANLCAYCGEATRLTRDHVIPVSRGGSDDITNIVPSCQPCNSRKHTMSLEEFRAVT